MTAAPAPSTNRAFVPFIDEIDGTLCLPASATAADIRGRIGAHPLRFPLILDPAATLEQQIMASGFAPTSSRFGPYCDNIMGMNWRVPDGHIVRVGERVVKTTTGYDWFRFLLHSGRRFGQPTEYVIRLRPDCGPTGIFVMEGAAESVRQAAPLLLKDCWMHWFDAVDVIEQAGTCTLRITVHCPPAEWCIFENHLSAFAATQHLQFNVLRDTVPADGCPDLVLKTSPEHVLALAASLARTDGVRCVALCYNGLVHAYLPESVEQPARTHELARPHIDALHAIGGDWHSRHLPQPMPSAMEAAWIHTLENAIHDR